MCCICSDGVNVGGREGATKHDGCNALLRIAEQSINERPVRVLFDRLSIKVALSLLRHRLGN